MGQKILNGITVCNFAKIVARVLATTMFCAMTSHLITWLWRQHVAERLSARVFVGLCKRRSEQERIFPGLIYKDRYCVIHGHGVLRGVWQKFQINEIVRIFFRSKVVFCIAPSTSFSKNRESLIVYEIFACEWQSTTPTGDCCNYFQALFIFEQFLPLGEFQLGGHRAEKKATHLAF